MSNLLKKWYVFYTCPKSEKKANKHLVSLGYETFLPLKREYKVWRNRQKKLIEIPFFANYIFVYTFHSNIFEINKVQGICTCVTCGGIASCISDNDIMSLRIMQDMDMMIPKNNDFFIGDKIRVIDGPLCGYEGVLVKVKGISKFGISINCVNLMAIVDLETTRIEKL